MWFNLVTVEVYRGGGWTGTNRLKAYYYPYLLNSTNKSLIYKSILKHDHSNFTLAIL